MVTDNQPREPEPSYGADEEGDVPPPDAPEKDAAAWVHEKPAPDQ